MQKTETFMQSCGYKEKLVLKGALLSDIFDKLRESFPRRTSVIQTDAIDTISIYMRLVRIFSRLSGIEEEIKRIVAQSDPKDSNKVLLTFYHNGNLIEWRFDGKRKYLSQEFLDLVCRFMQKSAKQCVIEVSDSESPFMELLSLPSEVVIELAENGVAPIHMLVDCT